jgi:iron-sulfur cluster assembly accessory protein
MIHLSQAAVNEIKRLQLSRQLANSRLRIGFKTGGCSSLYYILEFEENTATEDWLSEIEDIIVAIAPQHQSNLHGLKIDYAEDLMGGGFRFHNPNAATTCSCGQSFALANAET